MDRIYMNRITGQRRIHIEIRESEIADLLDDFTPTGDAFAATKSLHDLLVQAHTDFSWPAATTPTKSRSTAPEPDRAHPVTAAHAHTQGEP